MCFWPGYWSPALAFTHFMNYVFIGARFRIHICDYVRRYYLLFLFWTLTWLPAGLEILDNHSNQLRFKMCLTKNICGTWEKLIYLSSTFRLQTTEVYVLLMGICSTSTLNFRCDITQTNQTTHGWKSLPRHRQSQA